MLAAALLLAGCGQTDSSEDDMMIRATIEHSSTTTATPEISETVTTTETTVTTTATTTEETTTTTEETTTTTEPTTTPPPETTTPEPVTTTEETTTTTTTTTPAPEPEPDPEPEPEPEPPAASLTKANFMVATTLSTTTITWDKSSGATGYTVMIRRGKDAGWEELADTKETSWKTSEFGRNRNYAFTVKAYSEKDGERTYAENSDVSEFPYITQKNGIYYVAGLMIVNKTYPLPESYAPGGLTTETQNAFNEMKNAAASEGVSLWVCSGYRSYAYQSTLYWGYVARDGSQASADRYSARPGHSEHQSGLCADLNYASRYFNGTPTAIWIGNNCWKYGFIIRYPEGKEDITGYNYESWHVRYVGKELSKILYESGQTLEEYYGLTSQYSN